MNTIDVSIPVAQVIDHHPEILDLLVEMGFKPLSNPLMRNTIGRKVTIQQGAKMIGLAISDIKQTLEWNGYEVRGIEDVR